MAVRSDADAQASDREIVLSRLFAAPRGLVFAAWTNPQHVGAWWGPKGFTTTTHEMDVRPGGAWRFVMHGPDGTDYQNTIVFVEVVPAEWLVYRHAGEGDHAEVRFQTTVTFADDGGGTRLTMRMEFPTAEARNHVAEKYGAVEGGRQTLERLGEHVAAMDPAGAPFTISRTFDAPRALVFRAWTETEHLTRWFGPVGFATAARTNDPRPGGVFHYCMRAANGAEMWGKWVYREVAPPERLVFVSSFSDAEGGTARAPFSADWPLEVLSTVTFAEQGGKTTVALRAVPINATESERKAFLAMHGSMRQGWGGTLDQLAAYLPRA